MEVNMNIQSRPDRTTSPAPKATPGKKTSTAARTQRTDTYERSDKTGIISDWVLTVTPDAVKGAALRGERPSGVLDICETEPGSQKKELDWGEVERAFMSIDSSPDRICYDLDHTVRHVATLYVTAKHALKEQYPDEDQKGILEDRLGQLDRLYKTAKERVAASYEKAIGSFYDNCAGKGTGAAMKDSLMTVMDQKVAEAEKILEDKDLSDIYQMDVYRNYPFDMTSFMLQCNLMSNEEDGISDEIAASGTLKAKYSLDSLKAAAVVAEAAHRVASGRKAKSYLVSDVTAGVGQADSDLTAEAAKVGKRIDEETLDMLLEAFKARQRQGIGAKMRGAYQYAINQYKKAGEMETATVQGQSQKTGEPKGLEAYGGIRFFCYNYYEEGEGTGRQMSYRFDVGQFMELLESGEDPKLVRSIAKDGPSGLLACG